VCPEAKWRNGKVAIETGTLVRVRVRVRVKGRGTGKSEG